MDKRSASSAHQFFLSIREHWQIENNLHWMLDIAYREDQSRIRDENSALNMSWLSESVYSTSSPSNSNGRISELLWFFSSGAVFCLRFFVPIATYN